MLRGDGTSGSELRCGAKALERKFGLPLTHGQVRMCRPIVGQVPQDLFQPAKQNALYPPLLGQ